jgi:hypothetical protein
MSLLKSDLKVNHYVLGVTSEAEKHAHVPINTLYSKFGLKDSLCIRRNYVDRWVSSLRLVWGNMLDKGLEPIIKWQDIDNNFIYEKFDEEYINSIHNANPIALEINDTQFSRDYIEKLNNRFIKNNNNDFLNYNSLYFTFYSQSYWTGNKKCTYEFDISDISKFQEFISDRYSIDFKLHHINESSKIPNKIIVDDTFKSWVFNNFEKRFLPVKKLI